ncbi:suppressor of lurcher protein 1-like [Mytilus californianus]|uniref:suppressor of lurcher protein 1-like n=1 Tax=Mytilus californianus TaxID=6549 RepID=UPI0022454CC0|nr:suppressor of lurcher protein 1-like [Mytilus californianus]
MPPLWYFGLIQLAHVITVNYATINPDKDNCINYESDYHVDRACECIVYQSLGGTEGRFNSPNFPQFYSRGIECILFTFIGDVGELVEIKFTDFEMMYPDVNKTCKDYLRLFLKLNRPEINENMQHNYELCGSMSTLQQKTFYSKDRSLIMEFQTTRPIGQQLTFFKGFRGFFRFLDARQFVSDGVKQSGTMCSWDFSTSKLSGKFFSPLYPQNYPSHSKCQYTFYGQPHEGTVYIQFQNLQIYDEGVDSCSKSSDRIAIYDGMNSSQPLIKYLCGIKNQEEVKSTTPYLYIEFLSDGRNQRQGFAANYTFQHKSHSNLPSYSNPDYSTTTTFNCNQYIESKTKHGIITSQNHPGSYPASTRCTYIFNGTAEERIQIKFTRMDLFFDGGNPNEPYDCDGQDSIKIYIKIDNDEKELDYTCGKKIPKMVMSNIPWMKVVFESGSRTQHSNTGFAFEYKFLTNYGITTGEQDNRKECRFTFNSNRSLSGYFTSPNFPGYYPRFTECHYKFIGQNHKVRITFVEYQLGSRCEPKDRVDYVDFSNFDGGAQDKKMHKFCGQMTEKMREPIQSDLEFFRVTFKSNSMYEGKGFNATYEFVINEETTFSIPPKSLVDTANTMHTSYIDNKCYCIVFYLVLTLTIQFLTGCTL